MAELQRSTSDVITLPEDARILVICVARIGDTLLTTPLMRALKNATPSGSLECIAHPQRASVLLNLPFVDKVAPQTKKSAWLRGRTGRQWDYAFVLGHDEPLLQLALRASARVVAFQQENHKLNQRLWRSIPSPHQAMHAVLERFMLTKPVGIDPQDCDLRLAYQPTHQEVRNATRWLLQAFSESRNNTPLIIGVQLQSFHAKAYRNWPVSHFLTLAERILEPYPNARFVILGGAADVDCAKRFHATFPRHTAIACGEFSLRDSAAVMSLLDAYIGVDTGPTHLAGALGLPMVALYHCYHPGRLLKPLMHPAPLRVVEHPRAESACQRSTPMAEISVESVWDALKPVLAQVTASARTRSHAAHE